MKTILVAAALLLGCVDARPLGSPCTSGFDCNSGEWCVKTWRGTGAANELAGNVCAPQCSFDSDCGDARCAEVGDAVTADLDSPLFFACRQ